MGYLTLMMTVWCVMNVLAEMVTYLPMRGITGKLRVPRAQQIWRGYVLTLTLVPYFVGRFLDPSLAFAAGWNYWYAYAMLVGAEATAAGIIIEYWVSCVLTLLRHSYTDTS